MKNGARKRSTHSGSIIIIIIIIISSSSSSSIGHLQCPL